MRIQYFTIVCGLLLVMSVVDSRPASADEKAVSPAEIQQRISTAMKAEDNQAVVEGLTELIKIDDSNPQAWYLRGVYQFRLGHFKESVSDFDKYVELNPTGERRLWERGISHYYAGMFKEGAEQFALYQTYHDNDVENSVWRYICMARDENLEAARKEMLPIRNDPRVPLMEAYALFQGKSTPEKVIEVAKAGEPDAEELAFRMFYADLYLGLYYEAHGKPELAKDHIQRAWKDHTENDRISRYMWHVARVHAKWQNEKNQPERD